MRITKSITFDAAHYLNTQSAEEAGRPYARMHGHSFSLEVTLEGTPDQKTGWVTDFGDVTDALEALREDLDHRLLNEVEGLSQPTLENICLWTAKRLSAQFKNLVQVKVARPSNGETCVYDIPATSI